MTYSQLTEEVALDCEMLTSLIREMQSLRADVAQRTPTVREKAAAGAFLAQFYGAIENVMKRICRFRGVALPVGDTWHVELFKRFSHPGALGLPVLLDDELAVSMSAYRKFRHVVQHGYAFQLDWDRMNEGMEGCDEVLRRFLANLDGYLDSEKSQS